jgi:hypothetical protein
MTNRILRRSIPTLLAAGAALLCACHSDSNENDIKPVRASISTPNPVPAGPAVYLRVAASDDPSDDVVALEVVLNPGAAPVVFDAFNIEILPTDPNNPGVLRDGIVQMTFDTAMGSTPFGACNSCVKGLTSGGCTGFPACTPCGACPQGPIPPADPVTSPVSTPICASATSNTRSFLASADILGNSGCAPASASSEIVIAVIPVFARTVGTARLNFVDNLNNPNDCAILLSTAIVPGVTFDDRGAVFTAAR